MNAMVQSFQNMGSIRIVTLTVVGAILLAVFAFLSFRLSSPVMTPLYTNLSQEDAGRIVTELGSMGVSFQIASGGGEVLVNSADVLRVRMQLAQKGLPNKGSIVGYEVFDRDVAMGTSNFVLNVNLVRALEGELGRTISSMSTIRGARVHLVMPKRNLFEREAVRPSASVVLNLQDQSRMPAEETRAVRHMVSSAVPGMKAEDVTVVDSNGKILARGASAENGEAGAMAPENAAEMQLEVELRYRQRIENLLEKVVGVGKVQAQVTAAMSFDRVVTNEEVYDPDGAVARSVQTSEEVATSRDGGAGSVSVANNLPSGAAGGVGGDSSSTEKADEVTNFEISRKVTNQIQEVGKIQKLSVAVLIDGRYQTVIAAGEGGDDEEVEQYIPRTDEELEQLNSLVQTAIGYDRERGDNVEIINMQFTNEGADFLMEEGPFDWLIRDLDSIIKTFMVGIVAILTIMLIIRPLVQRAFEVTAADDVGVEENSALQVTSSGGLPAASAMEYDMVMSEGQPVSVEMIQSNMGNAPAKRINELIDNNPEETLAVIRTWLRK